MSIARRVFTGFPGRLVRDLALDPDAPFQLKIDGDGIQAGARGDAFALDAA